MQIRRTLKKKKKEERKIRKKKGQPSENSVPHFQICHGSAVALMIFTRIYGADRR